MTNDERLAHATQINPQAVMPAKSLLKTELEKLVRRDVKLGADNTVPADDDIKIEDKDAKSYSSGVTIHRKIRDRVKDVIEDLPSSDLRALHHVTEDLISYYKVKTLVDMR